MTLRSAEMSDNSYNFVQCFVCIFLGAFLIPYLICVIIGGIPLFFLEVAVGQFMGVAGIKAWSLVPIFRGKMAKLAFVINL